MTKETLCTINIYCDESRHTSDPHDSYMVIGAISCPAESKREIVHQIHVLKREFNTQGEFGWKRLSPNKHDFYWALIEKFKEREDLSFRCLVVDKNILDHDRFSDGDSELGFYKLYYQMLVHWLKPDCSYRIFLDWQQNKEQHRFSDLRLILRKKLMGRARIDCLEPVTSHNLPLLELADLFIGAVGYQWNERSESETKIQFCKDLAAAVGLPALKTRTPLSREKFNIFHFVGR